MDRYELLKIIPKPQNSDVIIYDTTLTNLLDEDVFKKYNDDLAAYNLKNEHYIKLQGEVKVYREFLNNFYLYDKSWNEVDYMEVLKKEKKNFNTMYSEIKKIEDNIAILNKKYKTLNEQIEIQRNKEIKEVEDKRKNIDAEIENNRQKINEIYQKIKEIEIDFNRYKKLIEENIEDTELIKEMQNTLNNDEFKCKYCGTVITHASSKKRVFNLLQKNIEKNEMKLLSLQDNLYKAETSLAFYQSELSNYKSMLRNNLEFKKEDYNFYIKKSVKILELEAVRDDVLKKLSRFKSQLDNNSQTKTKQFLDIKDRISKYELSLENLRKIKENKENFKSKNQEINKLKEEINTLKFNLEQYKKFIQIYYKIYEQKINNYFGSDFKFKFFKFDEFNLIEIFEVYYKDIEYTQLNAKLKKEFDDIYMEKISYFSY